MDISVQRYDFLPNCLLFFLHFILINFLPSALGYPLTTSTTELEFEQYFPLFMF